MTEISAPDNPQWLRAMADLRGADRLIWVDTAKGIGIILVVVGHVLRGLVHSKILISSPGTQFVDTWIYAFHMPLFFFLSGLFLFRSTKKAWNEFVSDKIRVLAYPYLVWSAITLLIKASMGTVVNQPYKLSDFPLIFYQPIDQFWFLYALFVLLIVVSALLRWKMGRWGVLSITILVYPGVLPGFSHEPGISVEIQLMAIYLACGLVVGNAQRVRAWSCVRMPWLALSGAAGLLGASLAAWPAFSHQQLLQPAFAVSGIAGAVAVALLADTVRFGAAIQILGRHSLEIYLMHTIASGGTRIVLAKVFEISSPTLHFTLGTSAGLLLPLVVVLLFRALGFQFGFTIPQRALGQFEK